MRKIHTIVLLIAGSVLLAGCQKTGPFGGESAIRFKAVSNVGTKTAYSGAETEESGHKYERIDWKQGDLIRVWSNVAVHRYNQNQHWSDYIVTADGIADNRTSTASLAAQNLNNVPGNGTGNGLVWDAAGDYTFYGLYPSGDNADGASGVFNCEIPSDQNPVFDSGVGSPDMSYAYMASKASVTTNVDGEGVPVTLRFDPAFTAFQISLRSAEETLYLGSFSIQSEGGSPIAGKFSIDLNGASDIYSPSGVAGETQSQVTVPLNDTELTSSADLKFTVFTLPETFSDLSITFNVKTDPSDTDYTSRTLQLKQDDAYIQFLQCAKHRIYGLALSAETWEIITVTGEDIFWDTEAWGEDIVWDAN